MSDEELFAQDPKCCRRLLAEVQRLREEGDTLRAQVAELRAALLMTKRYEWQGSGPCWCDEYYYLTHRDVVPYGHTAFCEFIVAALYASSPQGRAIEAEKAEG